ncbi:MAG: hypothetical protein ACRD4G_08670, partial [Bryobacteraceae bacterium]
IVTDDRLSARARAAHSTFAENVPLFDFPNTARNCLARQAAGSVHQRHPAEPQAYGLIRSRDASRPFVQIWPYGTELSCQIL